MLVLIRENVYQGGKGEGAVWIISDSAGFDLQSRKGIFGQGLRPGDLYHREYSGTIYGVQEKMMKEYRRYGCQKICWKCLSAPWLDE